MRLFYLRHAGPMISSGFPHQAAHFIRDLYFSTAMIPTTTAATAAQGSTKCNGAFSDLDCLAPLPFHAASEARTDAEDQDRYPDHDRWYRASVVRQPLPLQIPYATAKLSNNI